MTRPLIVLATLFVISTLFASHACAQRGPSRRTDAKLKRQFDKDENGWLDADERKAAREFHEENKRKEQEKRGRRRGRRGGDSAEQPAVEAGKSLAPEDVQQFGSDVPLYDPGTLRTLFFEFEDDNWQDELDAFYHTDVELPAKLTVDGKKYENVGVQYRGNSSYFAVSPGRKKSMSITLDHVIDGQNLYGYRALTLLNAHADPTFLHSVLYLEMARDYMIAPKANFVRVVINGESFGVFVNQQRFNKDFLKDAYDTKKGIRIKSSNRSRGGGLSYLGDNPDDYRAWYEIKSADKDKSWEPLINVCRVLHETPPEQLKEKLEPIFDIDGALRFLALDIVMMSGDGYWLYGSELNLYVDKNGVLHILHHDANEAFTAQGGGRRDPDGPRTVDVEPFANMDDANKALRQKLLVVSEFRQKYLEYVRDIATNSMNWEKLGPRIEACRELIGADVESDTKKLYSTEQFNTSVYGDGEKNPSAGTLKGFVQQRREFLLNHPDIKALDEKQADE